MLRNDVCLFFFFFFQAEDGIRDYKVTGVQTCALPICPLLHFCPLVQYLRTEPSCKLTAGLHCSRYAGKHAQSAQFQRRSEEHTSELQSPCNLVCRLLLEKKKNKYRLHLACCCRFHALH